MAGNKGLIFDAAATRWAVAVTLLLIFGLLGIALAAFQWTLNPMFVTLRQTLAEELMALSVSVSAGLGLWRINVGAGGTAIKIAAGLLWLVPPALITVNGWLMFFHWTNRYHV